MQTKTLATTIALATVGLGIAAPVGVVSANAAQIKITGRLAQSAPIIKQGQSGARVTAVQHLLRHHGYKLNADGSFGGVTQQAVKDFQRQQGLQADGVVGGRTIAALAPTTQRGANGDKVRAVQQLLRASGHDLAVDGAFGPTTEAAVKSFQKKKGLTVDGVVGAKTWPALFAAATDAKGGKQPGKVPGKKPGKQPGKKPSGTPKPPTNDAKPQSGDITRADLEAMFPGRVSDSSRVEEGLPSLNEEMRKRGINNPARKAAFLATIAHESAFDYAAGEVGYDEYSYRGRGYIQLTNDFNYEDAGDYLGVDLMGDNQSRASELQYSAPIAGWYWTVARTDTNEAADNFNMGRVSANIGYDNSTGEDGRRCESFKTAYRHLAGKDAPSVTCDRN